MVTNAGVRITLVFLIARSEGYFGRKSIRKPIKEIKIRFMDQRTVFFHGETVGFCLNAPAGPYRLPSIFNDRAFVEAGGLMSYGPNRSERGQRLAAYVDKLLKGAKPGDLPIEQPTTFEFVINLKTAQALGTTLSPTLLFQADEVIR
jgi:hypothetical protein